MTEFFSIFSDDGMEARAVVGEYEIWVGYQPIKIKILVDVNGNYSYRLDHHYKGTSQAGPYISSISGFKSLAETLEGAHAEIFLFYREDDEGAEWVPYSRY